MIDAFFATAWSTPGFISDVLKGSSFGQNIGTELLSNGVGL